MVALRQRSITRSNEKGESSRCHYKIKVLLGPGTTGKSTNVTERTAFPNHCCSKYIFPRTDKREVNPRLNISGKRACVKKNSPRSLYCYCYQGRHSMFSCSDTSQAGSGFGHDCRWCHRGIYGAWQRSRRAAASVPALSAAW